VVDAAGNVRQIALAQIRVGLRYASPGRPFATVAHPGLAVDPDGGRAFVVPAGDRLAEIDLATLRVTYRDTSETRSMFARFRDWIDPPAYAKGLNGPSRQAVWLGDGKLAVTGSDSSENATRMAVSASGLRIVDARSWKYRKLDGGVSSVRLAGGMLLATGGSYSFEGENRTETAIGVIGYSLDGTERYRAFADASVGFSSYGGRGYATVSQPGGKTKTFRFDAATGRPGREVPSKALWHLFADGSPFLDSRRPGRSLRARSAAT
jgi:hypothetical protein